MEAVSLYNDLDKAKHEIRLLEILPSNRVDDPIECLLTTHSIDSYPKFLALSYTWGDATTTVDIVLNGARKAVTINLVIALQHLRKIGVLRERVVEESSESDAWYLLWVDALCINQDDVSEKNHQVQLMRRIYNEATVVVSWVGPDSPSNEISTAFKLFELLWVSLESTNVDGLSQEDYREHNLLSWMEDYPFLLEESLKSTGPLASRYWDAVESFFRCQYFSRKWVIQEMALAKSLMFLTDTSTIEGKKVFNFASWLNKIQNCEGKPPEWMPLWLWIPLHLKGFFHGAAFFFTLEFLSIAQEEPSWTQQKDLNSRFFYRAVLSTTACCVSEPKDAIFALSGLPGAITVDYEKPLRDLYCGFFDQYSIRLNKRLDFLDLSGSGWGSANDFNLPSWTPDFSQPPNSTWLINSIYNADRSMLWRDSQNTIEKWLMASGCECDIVASIEPELKLNTPQFISFVTRYAWQSGVSQSRYITGITRQLALLRSFLFDCHGLSIHTRLDLELVESQYTCMAALREFFCEDPDSDTDFMLDIKLIAEKIGITSINPLSALMCSLLPDSPPNDIWKDEDLSSDLLLGGYTRITLPVSGWHEGSWRAFHTRKGYLGIGPPEVRVGDVVSVLAGCSRPVILRQEEHWFWHVGICFVLGFMDGEAADQIREGKLKERFFEIH